MLAYCIYAFVVFNLVTMFCYGLDKYRATNKKWRIPEKVLLLLALLGGALGAMVGMLFFHHKTQKTKFSVLVPVFLVLQAIVVFVLLVKYYIIY